jgi:hypothetical protein
MFTSTSASFTDTFMADAALLASPQLNADDMLMPLSPMADASSMLLDSTDCAAGLWAPDSFDADFAASNARAWSPYLTAADPSTSYSTLDMMDLSRIISVDAYTAAAADGVSTAEPLVGWSDCHLHGIDAAHACSLATAGSDSPYGGVGQSHGGCIRAAGTGHGGDGYGGQCAGPTGLTVDPKQRDRRRRACDEQDGQCSEHRCCCSAGEECRRAAGKRDQRRVKPKPIESCDEWSRRRLSGLEGRQQHQQRSQQQRAC